MDFPTTNWTMLAQATLHGDTTAGKALGNFIERYRGPVMRLLRYRGIVESRVEDLTHDFFLRLMHGSTLSQADPSRGRFRSFLGSTLKCFLADDVDRAFAQKRGGGAVHVPLDALAEQVPAEMNGADGQFLDYQWALHIMQHCLAAICAEWETAGKADRFAVLRHFLPGGTAALSQTEAAAQLGLSDTALRTEITRLRSRFRALVREEVAATVSSPQDLDDELRHLRDVLQTVPAGMEAEFSQLSPPHAVGKS